MANEKISFDEARARAWQQDVRAELDTTNNLLAQIGPVLEEYDEEDDLLREMKNAGNTLVEKFKNLVGGFTETIDIIDSAVQKTVDAVAKGIQFIIEKAKEL